MGPTIGIVGESGSRLATMDIVEEKEKGPTEGLEKTEVIRGAPNLSVADSQSEELVRLGKGLTPWHLRVVELVSQYKQPKEIVAELTEGLDSGAINEAWIVRCSSTLARTKQQQAIIDYFRDLAWQRRRDIPIVNPSVRAAIRNRLVAKNLDIDAELVRKVLQDAEQAYSEDVQDDRQAGVTINIGQFQGLQGLSGGPNGPVDDGLIVLEATPGVALPEFGAVNDGQPADEMVDVEAIDDSLADSEGDSGSEVEEDEKGDSQVNID